MRYVRFGRTEAQVPVVSLGTWAYGGENTNDAGVQVGWSGHDEGDARAAVQRAWEAGITHWDTADVYGDGRSEALLGAMWREHGGAIPRDEIFLATKIGYVAGDHGHPYHPEHVRRQLDASLANLQTDVIDLYYLHHCDFGPDDRYLDGALEVVRRAQEAGKIRFVGLSDWRGANIMRVIERVDPDVLQPYRNVTHDDWESSGMRGWVEEHDLGVAFFSPIRHGLLLGKYLDPTTFPEGDFRNNDKMFRDPHALERLRESAARLRERFGDVLDEPLLGGLTMALLADAPTGCVLLGQRNERHVDAAARAGAGEVSAEDAAWVKAQYADLRS